MSHLEPMSGHPSPPTPPYPKLPLGRVIGLSYSTYFHHFIDALRTSWVWLVVVGPLTGFAAWRQFSWFAAVLARMPRGMPPTTLTQPPEPIETVLLMNLSQALMLLAGVSIAVTWHRMIILGERPGLSASNVTSKNLWRYIGVGLVIILITALPLVLVLAPMVYFIPKPGGTPPPTWFFALIPVFMVLYCMAMALMLRLSLLLPARAIGDVDLTFKQTWNRSRGNTWRMFWGIAACTLPPLLLAQIVYVATIGFSISARPGGEDFAAQMTANSVVFMVYYLLILPIGIGFLSHAYRHFFQGGIEPALEGNAVPRTQRSV
jgi:hypothetical protein